MRKIVFGWGISADCRLNGYHDAQEIPDHVTDEELDTLAWEMAVEEAERYRYYPDSWALEEDELPEDNEYTEVDSWWEDYDPEKHDAKRPGGGKWFP